VVSRVLRDSSGALSAIALVGIDRIEGLLQLAQVFVKVAWDAVTEVDLRVRRQRLDRKLVEERGR